MTIVVQIEVVRIAGSATTAVVVSVIRVVTATARITGSAAAAVIAGIATATVVAGIAAAGIEKIAKGIQQHVIVAAAAVIAGIATATVVAGIAGVIARITHNLTS